MIRKFLISTFTPILFLAVTFCLPQNIFAALGDYTGIAFSTGNNGFTKGVVFYNNHFYYLDNSADQVYEFNTSNVYTGVSFDISSSGATESTDITTYNDFFWITDNTDDEVYKYNPDGTYTGVHFDTAGSGSDNPMGITAYNDFFWIVDPTDDEVYKYNPDGTYTGTHFDTAGSGNGNATSIVSYNDFFWITDSADLEVYQYDSSGVYTGTHFDTSGEMSAFQSITVYNDFFWIADTDSSGGYSLMFKYDSAGVYTSESFDVRIDEATFPINIAVYIDFFWILKNGPTFVSEEGVVKYNPDGTLAGFSFLIEQQGGSDFLPNGIVYYDGFFYIVPIELNFAVYKYNLDGTYTGLSFDTSVSGNESPRGIATYNDFFYIVDDLDAEVYKYQSDGTYTGVSFDTAINGSDSPKGIFAYDNFFWITDDVDDEVYKYNPDGTYTGISFDTAISGNDRPVGIAVYGGDFYITNLFNSKIYEYELPPTISVDSPVENPTEDSTPNFSFLSSEAGDITYGGSCTSNTTAAVVGVNTITFTELPEGDYADCTIFITDDTDNDSNILAVPVFTVEERSHTSSGSNPHVTHDPDPDPEVPPDVVVVVDPEPVEETDPVVPVVEEDSTGDPIIPVITTVEEEVEEPDLPVEETDTSVETTPVEETEITSTETNTELETVSLIDGVSGFIKSPVGKVASRSLTLAALGLAFLVGIFANVGSLADIGLNLLRFWSMFLYGVGLKKRNRPWGVVYDSVTKQPLDPVYVVLLDLQGKEVATSITDMDGRYGFLVEPGIYKIKVNKNNYTFPSTKLVGKTSDELYSDLYFGETIEIKEKDEVIAKNIPMDQIGFNWNEFAKKEQSKMKFYHTRDVVLSRFTEIFTAIGFLVSFAILFVLPEPYNVIVFCLYLVLFSLKHAKLIKKKKGSVVYSKSGIPISYGIIRMYGVASGVEMAHRVLDKKGSYYMLIGNGEYLAMVEKKNEDGSYTKVFSDNKVIVKHGILKKNFRV